MKRILIDYKKLDHHVAGTLIDSYPDGYGDDDIITIKKPNGEVIEAVVRFIMVSYKFQS